MVFLIRRVSWNQPNTARKNWFLSDRPKLGQTCTLTENDRFFGKRQLYRLSAALPQVVADTTVW